MEELKKQIEDFYIESINNDIAPNVFTQELLNLICEGIDKTRFAEFDDILLDSIDADNEVQITLESEYTFINEEKALKIIGYLIASFK